VSAGQIWKWPLILAVLTMLGLLAALLGQDALWRAVSWAALAAPLAVILVCIWRS
jgi:asparagine N-glycosylation enzyme membrane subunit Stt3